MHAQVVTPDVVEEESGSGYLARDRKYKLHGWVADDAPFSVRIHSLKVRVCVPHHTPSIDCSCFLSHCCLNSAFGFMDLRLVRQVCKAVVYY